MEIKIHKPINKQLAKYVLYYYETIMDNVSYFAYPHFNTPVSYTYNTEIQITANDGVHLGNKKGNGDFFFTLNKFNKPLSITSCENIKEFNIVFTPFGLAQFGNDMSSSISSKKNTVVPLFQDFGNTVTKFNSQNTQTKIMSMEQYLVTVLKPITGTNIVERALEIMYTSELSINDIATRCNCSQKKLYRLFIQICGTTPSNLKKIIRFRKALEQVKIMDSSFNLTEIAFGNGYYDQPYFNKEFKRLTGEKPGAFFKQVDIETNENIYFKKC